MTAEATELRIFVIGTGGFASKILTALIARGENVVGVCCQDDGHADGWLARLARKLRRTVRTQLVVAGILDAPVFEYEDPFADTRSPSGVAARHGIPRLEPRNLRSNTFEASLKALAPDLILVAGFRQLIPRNVIGIPVKAILNFHPSLLPKHRGGTPSRWVIRSGDKETGVTVHLVNEAYDRGDLVLQERVPVHDGDTYGDLELRLSDVAAALCLRIVDMAKRGPLAGTPQAHDLATHEPPYKGHHQTIDWRLPAPEIQRTCYAIRPRSGGMTSCRGKPVCIWEVDVCSEEPLRGRPGQVIAIDRDGALVVSCGVGAVRVRSFLHSGVPIPARKLRRRLGIDVGSVFA